MHYMNQGSLNLTWLGWLADVWLLGAFLDGIVSNVTHGKMEVAVRTAKKGRVLGRLLVRRVLA